MRRTGIWISVGLFGVGTALVLWWRHEQATRDPGRVELRAEIQVLPPAERVRLANESRGENPPLAPEHADNPFLLCNTYARVVVRNPTDRDVTLFAFRNPSWVRDPGLGRCFAVEAVIHDGAGNELPPGMLVYTQSMAEPRPSFGPALKAENRPTFVLAAGESVMLPIWLMNGHTGGRGFRPGTYTIRARVTYADARDGEAQQLISNPLTLDITQHHIDIAKSNSPFEF